jgi:hypothetical protein
MTDESDKCEIQGTRRDKDCRQGRLRLALRDNLKRRKSQARDRAKMKSGPSNDHEGPLDDET